MNSFTITVFQSIFTVFSLYVMMIYLDNSVSGASDAFERKRFYIIWTGLLVVSINVFVLILIKYISEMLYYYTRFVNAHGM